MNDVLEEIYGTIIPSAPYIIVAYALVLVALFVYVFIVMRGTRKAERQLEVLEEALRDSKAAQEGARAAVCNEAAQESAHDALQGGAHNAQATAYDDDLPGE